MKVRCCVTHLLNIASGQDCTDQSIYQGSNLKLVLQSVLCTSLTRHQNSFVSAVSSNSSMCLTHSPVMEGVCKPMKSCQSYQGFCDGSGNVCCVGKYLREGKGPLKYIWCVFRSFPVLKNP